MDDHLIPLSPGSTITIGRKATCNVVVDSLLVSNCHCKVSVATATSSSNCVASLLDCSRNGTWVRRGVLNDVCNGDVPSTSKSTSKRRTERMCNGGIKELYVGDSIVLLAPSQKSATALTYTLIEKDRKLFLKRSGIEGTDGVAADERRTEEDGAAASKKHKVGAGMDEATGRKRKEDAEAPVLAKRQKMEDFVATKDAIVPEVLVSEPPSGTFSQEDAFSAEELGRCPICRKLFHALYLPIHCPACQEPYDPHNNSKRAESMEECVFCTNIFPVGELAAHHEKCTGGDTEKELEACGVCPSCSTVLPILQLIEHSAMCRKNKRLHPGDAPVATATSSASVDEMESDGTKLLISAAAGAGNSSETGGGSAVSPLVGGIGASVSPVGGASVGCAEWEDTLSPVVLEQCAFCLEDFPLCEMPAHYPLCPSKKSKSQSEVTEHCVHCLALFPLDELVRHSAVCKERRGDKGGEGVAKGDPLERCMYCFKDFPLSEMVEHSRLCKGAQNGPTDRFKNFLPSIHDLEPMPFLTAIQRKAVEYVTEKSKRDSEAVYPNLVARVVRLGYSEADLKNTLQWIRRDAPIIIHINLDRCLRYLLEDTHYRNLFETNTGGGGTCKRSRMDWENRIFNRIYRKGVIPFDRVKYGVLNIVGDPRGVQCCYSYGDSFLQLKKVRLRTTFASCDTARSGVKLSCCEHYGNVIYEYSDMELKAIMDVATRKKSFLRSNIIQQYKEVQIHGPVVLCEHVDCIVVNERHKHCPTTVNMLQNFVEKNNCNLIWMERADTIDYPSFNSS